MKKLLLISAAILLINMIGIAQNNSSTTLKAMKVDANTSIIDLKTGEVVRTVRATKSLDSFQATMKKKSSSTNRTFKTTHNTEINPVPASENAKVIIQKETPKQKASTKKEVKKTVIPETKIINRKF